MYSKIVVSGIGCCKWTIAAGSQCHIHQPQEQNQICPYWGIPMPQRLLLGDSGTLESMEGPCWPLFGNGGAVRCFDLGDKCRCDFLGVPSLWRTSNGHSPVEGLTPGLFQRSVSWGAVSYNLFFLTDYQGSPGEQSKEVSVLQVPDVMQDKSHL